MREANSCLKLFLKRVESFAEIQACVRMTFATPNNSSRRWARPSAKDSRAWAQAHLVIVVVWTAVASVPATGHSHALSLPSPAPRAVVLVLQQQQCKQCARQKVLRHARFGSSLPCVYTAAAVLTGRGRGQVRVTHTKITGTNGGGHRL